MKNKRPLIAIPVLLALALGVWRYEKRADFRYAGTVEATDVDLSPRISSTISTVTVREGDSVHAGQVLVELGCEDLKLAADIARRDSERAERLFKEGSTPQETYERQKNRRDATALSVSWCRLVSPIDGTVLARVHEPGEWAQPGVKLLTLADMGATYAYVYVPQSVLYALRPGDLVPVFLPEAGDQPRRGTIAFIRPEAEFTPKNVQTREERTRLVFGVKILLDNQDRVLKPGMPIEVRLPH